MFPGDLIASQNLNGSYIGFIVADVDDEFYIIFVSTNYRVIIDFYTKSTIRLFYEKVE